MKKEFLMLPISRLSCLLPLAIFALAHFAFPSTCLAVLDPSDRDALLALDAATNRVLSGSGGWNGPPGTECSGAWIGVRCGLNEGKERVTQLLLGRHQVPFVIEGSLPAEIGKLTELTQFELTDQSLSGTLPADLGLLTKMTRLDFRRNQFSAGTVTESGLKPFMAMKALRFLNLEGNLITGPIPTEIDQLTSLTNLELTGNVLTGPIPAAIGQLEQLLKLWLDANQLQGSIPAEIGNLEALVELRLGGNNLVGPIPSSIGNLRSLTLLQIGLCRLSGVLPATLADLSNLQELSLGTNLIEGQLDSVAWEELVGLQRVFLDNNTLEGPVPPELLRLTGLSDLRLQGNKLIGLVPREVLALPSVVAIDLRWNGVEADPDVAARLDSASSGQFSRTQTLAPGGLRVSGTSLDGVRLTWNPVSFQDVPGGYRVSYRRSDVPDGPPQIAVVPGKAVTTTEIRGLEAGTVYAFQVQTFSDPHAANQSTVTSGVSAAVFGSPAAEERRGQIVLTASAFSAAEGQLLRVGAARTGGVDGPLQATLILNGGGANPARVGRDVDLITQSVRWVDQEGGTKEILISVAADNAGEPTETVRLQLQASSSRLIGSPGVANIELLDRAVAGAVDSPVVATNADGLELSVWTVLESEGSKRNIEGQFTAGLTASVTPLQFVITGVADVDEHAPEVFPLAETFGVQWLESQAADILEQRVVRYCQIDLRTGRCKKKAKAIVLDSSVTEFSSVADRDTFWLVWRANSGIRLAQFNGEGRVMGKREIVTSDPTATQPRIARFGQGGVFATWTAEVPLDPGDPRTARPVLQGRSFAPARGLGRLLPDLAGAEAVELRDFKLLTRADGTVLLSWIGITLKDAVPEPDAVPKPLREGPQIHLRRLGLSGALEGGEVVLGCASCGDLVESHSVVSDPVSGDCVAAWVVIPGSGAADPAVRRAKLENCESSQPETQLQLVGTPFRIRRVEIDSLGDRLLVLGQRSSAPSLDLRSYHCNGSTSCRN